MTATLRRYANTKAAIVGSLAICLAIAAVIAATRFATANDPPQQVQTLEAAGMSITVEFVEMTAAQTVVRIEVMGRPDLGHRLTHGTVAWLVDSAGTRHFEKAGRLDDRRLTLTFAGSASVAAGRAQLEIERLGVTDDPTDVEGEEHATYFKASALVIDLAATGGAVERTDAESSAVNGQGQRATVTSVVRDDSRVVVSGRLDGFSREEIQSLGLGARLMLADGSERPFRGGSSYGGGPELRDFSFSFALPQGSPAVEALKLQINPSVPPIVRQEATAEARARLDALEAAGAQELLIPLAASILEQQSADGDDYEQKRAKAASTPTDLSNALFKDRDSLPTPPEKSQFANELGFFVIGQYDDRNLSAEEKARDPVQNPRWPGFVRCMQDAGFGLDIADPDAAMQADIDRLEDEVNQFGPFYEATPGGLEYQSTPASDAFLACERFLYFEALPGVTATPTP